MEWLRLEATLCYAVSGGFGLRFRVQVQVRTCHDYSKRKNFLYIELTPLHPERGLGIGSIFKPNNSHTASSGFGSSRLGCRLIPLSESQLAIQMVYYARQVQNYVR